MCTISELIFSFQVTYDLLVTSTEGLQQHEHINVRNYYNTYSQQIKRQANNGIILKAMIYAA